MAAALPHGAAAAGAAYAEDNPAGVSPEIVYYPNLRTLCQGFSLCQAGPAGANCTYQHPDTPVKWRFPTRYTQPKRPTEPFEPYTAAELCDLFHRWLPLEHQVCLAAGQRMGAQEREWERYCGENQGRGVQRRVRRESEGERRAQQQRETNQGEDGGICMMCTSQSTCCGACKRDGGPYHRETDNAFDHRLHPLLTLTMKMAQRRWLTSYDPH